VIIGSIVFSAGRAQHATLSPIHSWVSPTVTRVN